MDAEAMGPLTMPPRGNALQGKRARRRILMDLCRTSSCLPRVHCAHETGGILSVRSTGGRRLMRDFRMAIRQFRRQPRLALAIVSTLAPAMGMNVAVFSVVHAVMFRTLPFTSPERIVWIVSVRPDSAAAPFSLPEFIDYSAQTRTLSGLAAYANWSASLEGEGITERLQ